MKKLLFITTLCLLTVCGLQAQTNVPQPEDFVGGLAEDGRGADEIADDIYNEAAMNLPTPDMLGPLPLPLDESNLDVLYVVNLGAYQTIGQLKVCHLYEYMCEMMPALKDINDVAVDRGSGCLWLILPARKGTSLAINEYNMDIFNGVQADGKVLYRTEQAKPILVRMPIDAPGSVRINAVDNQGNTIDWIPTCRPDDNSLNGHIKMVDLTFLKHQPQVITGQDYVAKVQGRTITLRFYEDLQVRVDNDLMHYAEYVDTDGRFVLYVYGDNGKSFWATTEQEPRVNETFNMTIQNGYDFGVGLRKPITFNVVF